MNRLILRLGMVALVAAAMIYGCAGDEGSPSAPQIQATALRAQSACGEFVYLSELSPILPVWEDSIEAWLGAALDDTPVWSDGSTVAGYLDALVPSLKQWQAVINDSLASAVLDTVSDFDPATTPRQGYLAGLSSMMISWKASLDAQPGVPVLPAPPVFQPDVTAPEIICVADTTLSCADTAGVVIEFDVVAVDDCDPAPVLTCDPPSGSTFKAGETVVTCTAVDSLGNTSTCSFTVNLAADATAPEITCAADVTIECADTSGTVVEFDVTAVDDCDPAPVVTCDPVSGSTFPVGETVVNCTAVDALGNTSTRLFTVTVVADTEPPVIVGATASPRILWPPNHKWRDIRISVDTEDECDSEPECEILGVFSNEPANSTGDGNTEPDWLVTGDTGLKLRAERSGNGSGRIYTVLVRCTDGSGNSAETTVQVVVPHDQGGGNVSSKRGGKGGGKGAGK